MHTLKTLDETLSKNILERLKRLPYGAEHHRIAAFDADGTLWANDVGVDFFKYQIQQKLLPGLPEKPLEHYHSLFETSTEEEALIWLAQINEGFTLEQVRSWASSCVNQNPPLYFPGLKSLIRGLQELQFEIFVVTASVKWAVEPAAKYYEIKPENVIGIETELNDQGQVTRALKGVVTWRQGKVRGLLEKTGGQRPCFVAGNTQGDLNLLENSTHLRLCLASAPPTQFQFKTEQFMQTLAKERGWFHFDFR